MLSMTAKNEKIGPTPETLAKLVPDVVDELVRKRVLKQRHADAAREIERVYLALCRGIFRGPNVHGVRIHGGRFRCPIERMTAEEERLWREHYAPWAKTVGLFAANVFDVKVNNRAPEDWELPFIREALQLYAELAGFAARRKN